MGQQGQHSPSCDSLTNILQQNIGCDLGLQAAPWSLETEPRSLKFCSRAVGRRDSEVPIVLGPGAFSCWQG